MKKMYNRDCCFFVLTEAADWPLRFRHPAYPFYLFYLIPVVSSKFSFSRSVGGILVYILKMRNS